MSSHSFVHLRVHTEFSYHSGANRVADIAKEAEKLGIPAVAMTDHNTIFGTSKFTAKLSGAGIQPIIGVTLNLSHDDGDGKQVSTKVAFLAKDDQGYRNLQKLISSSYLATTDGEDPVITIQNIMDYNEGLIMLTGGVDGPIHQAILNKKPELAKTRLSYFKKIFGDRIYAEIQRTNRAEEAQSEKTFIQIADETSVPLVATNSAYFMNKDDHEAYDVLTCIREKTVVDDQSRPMTSRECYFKRPGQMIELFSDLPDAIANTVEIAKRCAIAFEEVDPELPKFETEAGRTEAEELRHQAEEGLEDLFARLSIPEENKQEYRDRLEYELGVIINMQFPGYFLIVSDFIKWSKNNGIAVGPGRGSGAGSLVAFALKITDVDPIRYGLLFERFLNPDRVSMPDFDIDFCNARRDEVIQYVSDRYGEDKVARIGTCGTLQAKAAVQGAARALGVSFGERQRYSKMISEDASTLAEAVEMEPLSSELRYATPQVQKSFEIALKLAGLHSNPSTHAAGVVIGNKPITEIVPVMRDKHGHVITQLDMKAVEASGLVKFDFLGLKTLDILDDASNMLGGIDFDQIGVEDIDTYNMLSEGQSFGVFQLESTGMQKAMRQIKPTNIDDLIALVSLYRPGPMDSIPDYAKVKHGQKAASYLHELMRPILEETYGIIIYQEQVMELAKLLAGYSLGQADILRRAMGKKIQEEMDKQRQIFIDGASANNIPEQTAVEIFDLIAKFANYGFNKSHAAAYGIIAYRTAWLRQHRPYEFFAANLNIEMDTLEKLTLVYNEAVQMGVRILPPSINSSQSRFTVEKTNDGKIIRYALAGLRNVGATAMEFVRKERESGKYKDLADFVNRTIAHMNKRAYESLIYAGALDEIHPNRRAMIEALPDCIKRAQSDKKDQASGQANLFDAFADTEPDFKLPDIEEYPMIEKLAHEFHILGMYLTGHPLQLASRRLKHAGAKTIVEAMTSEFRVFSTIKVGALITSKTVRQGNNGMFAIVKISDMTGEYDLFLRDGDYEATKNTLREGEACVFNLSVSDKGGSRRLFFNEAEPLPLIEGLE